VLIGYFRDSNEGVGFPSGFTVMLGLGAFMASELHAMFRGARALNISDSGITVERSFGGKPLRMAWNEITRVEGRRSSAGPVWTFVMKDGRQIRWESRDFKGDNRDELERSLKSALEKHGVKLG
jgi:hypothetical protein